jgi:hypothetical protein
MTPGYSSFTMIFTDDGAHIRAKRFIGGEKEMRGEFSLSEWAV